ncbi:sugar phosphate nucleotidyltransferase [Neobacillus sp. MER 74]|uniref:sugar phosphate nucleotidyltransferase n=1 Tax=Bacillaceae TaxID=186817 RepID=UPI000BF4560C|nr:MULTISPECIES: sugar phosphate nucleotidyltransferase [Bacillaceae]MCM3118680.1 sugar phosphate nucleotidyltransferase [Neobacillus sp. MER 74]PFP25672.1 glucose-1-phosphate adenylyltransferase [Bacillus sp. AFS073361]
MPCSMLGIINATNEFDTFKNLTAHRSLASLPFAGRYRLVDFMLSNMVNSGITNVAIFTGKEVRSLIDHLGSGKQWDLDRKRDGLFVFSPEGTSRIERFGSFAHFAKNITYFLRSKQKYVVITNCNTIGSIDFCKILDHHIENEADITEVFHNGQSLQTYILDKNLLLSLFEQYKNQGYYTIFDVIHDKRHKFKINMYEWAGYITTIDSLQSYYQNSLDLLQPTVWKQVFTKNEPIFTKVKDEPPTQYKNAAKVTNSMIANGCIIQGEIDNSILFRSVKVGKGAVIRNSIIMQKCQIGENCILDSVILDKDVKIDNGVQLVGTREKPYLVEKGKVQKGR